MNNRLYKLMNWPQIEAVVYAESDNPSAVLGPHSVSTSILFQTFIPDAKEVRLYIPSEDKAIKMELVDETGFYAVLRPGKVPEDYLYIAEYEDGSIKKIKDAYKYTVKYDEKAIKKIISGDSTDAYKYMGAHITKYDGVSGTQFSFWAPNARRVSVVGEFNNYDGRVYQMDRQGDTGIFTIFIPGIKTGDKYLFEVNMKGGLSKCVIDPYSTKSAKDEDGYKSVVGEDVLINWTDKEYLLERDKEKNNKDLPISIYECNLGSYNLSDYELIAKEIVEHVKAYGYTHVEIKPIAEYSVEESLGYETIMYYTPTNRFGTPNQFAMFVNILHENGIKLILDWTLAHPSADEGILRKIDGTACYEHADARQGIHPQWGTLLFNYGRGEVKSFLMSNAFYWLKEFHVDGLRIDSLASVLCLDYGRNNGEWIANMYGGHENLDALDFIKQFNNHIKRTFPGVITIAEDSSAWPKVTASVEDGGLGFDYKWNIGWRDDYIRYISKDPIYRSGSHNDLTLSMLYCYSDRFVLPLSNDCGDLFDLMPGDDDFKLSGVKLSLAYLFMHPGIKLVSNGYDDYKAPKDGIVKLVKNLNQFYMKSASLFENDSIEEGFEWINSMDSKHCVLSFIRKSKENSKFIVVVCNFAGIEQELDVGVTIPGKYTRVLNTEATTFGGKYKVKEEAIYSIDSDVDGRPYCIPVTLPALSLSVFSYEAFDDNDRDYMKKLQLEAKAKADEATLQASKEEAKAKAAQKKAEKEQEKAKEAARIAEEARIRAEKEYAKAIEEMEKAREAMEAAEEAARKAEIATHRLMITEQSMKLDE